MSISQEATVKTATDALYLQPNRGVSSEVSSFFPAHRLSGGRRDLANPPEVLVHRHLISATWEYNCLPSAVVNRLMQQQQRVKTPAMTRNSGCLSKVGQRYVAAPRHVTGKDG